MEDCSQIARRCETEGLAQHLDAPKGSAGLAVGHGCQLPVKAVDASCVPQEVHCMAGLQECCCSYVHVQGEASLRGPQALPETQPSLHNHHEHSQRSSEAYAKVLVVLPQHLTVCMLDMHTSGLCCRQWALQSYRTHQVTMSSGCTGTQQSTGTARGKAQSAAYAIPGSCLDVPFQL